MSTQILTLTREETEAFKLCDAVRKRAREIAKEYADWVRIEDFYGNCIDMVESSPGSPDQAFFEYVKNPEIVLSEKQKELMKGMPKLKLNDPRLPAPEDMLGYSDQFPGSDYP